MGHKVSIFSHSFGSFVVPEMLLLYGDEPFQKVLIAAGRLDMPEAINQNTFAGKPAGFKLDSYNIASIAQLEKKKRTLTQSAICSAFWRIRTSPVTPSS